MRPLRLAIAIVAWDTLTIAILGVIAGTDPLRDYLSEIGRDINGVPWWYFAAGTVATVLHLWLARMIRHSVRRVGLWLLASFFILQWLGAWVQCDADCANITAEGITHYVVALAAFVCFGLSVIVISWRTKRPLHLAAIIAILAALALLASDMARWYNGLFERISLVAFGIWLIVLSLHHERTVSAAAPSILPE